MVSYLRYDTVAFLVCYARGYKKAPSKAKKLEKEGDEANYLYIRFA